MGARCKRRVLGLAALGLLTLVSLATAQNPPYSGTVFISTNIITSADWSAYESMTYAGLGSRQVFDRRVNQWLYQPMHLFNAVFADGLESEVQVNPEFGNQAAAAVVAEQYARVVGRLPTAVRVDADSITLHKGVQPFGGGNRNILIHTDQAIQYGGYLEEALFHEATHTSFDADHADSPGWLAAQDDDPTFISTYARDNPTREDVAESLLPWYALRHTSALFPFQVQAITAAIPNRLSYFDQLEFPLNVPPAPSGDFNDDGQIDAADFTVWRDSLGQSGLAPYSLGDANGDGVVAGVDYEIWKQQYGATGASGAIVPEPGSFTAMCCTCLSVAAVCYRQFRHVKRQLTDNGIDCRLCRLRSAANRQSLELRWR